MNRPTKPPVPATELPLADNDAVLASPPARSLARTENTRIAEQPDDDGSWTAGRHGADWSRAGNDLVVPEQPAIAIYENGTEAVVIRQAGQYGPDEDSWIIIQPHVLPFVIARLTQFLPQTGGAA
jgi:hypothetical protein